MTPKPMTLKTKTMNSPVGALKLIATDDALVAVLWPEEFEGRVSFEQEPEAVEAHPLIDAAIAQLGEYFAGTRSAFDVPLEMRGTSFQQQCWHALLDISFGETSTYGKQAANIGRPNAIRAVGTANGRNPLSIVVPCHRVVAKNGSLAGFAGGLDTKQWLLDHEQKHRAR